MRCLHRIFCLGLALAASATYAASRTRQRQPHTVFYSGGLVWRFTPSGLPPAPLDTSDDATFSTHLVQLGYTTNSMGYGPNSAVKSFFWQGEIEVGTGIALHYLHNIFHTGRLFSLDWGASVASQQSVRDGERFVTASLFPVLRLTPVRTAPLDVYVMYSLAGPTFISKELLDGENVGGHFTLQDQIGLGFFTGDSKRFNVEFRVGHFSNGNLLPRNIGIKVPLTISFGYAFK